ncbi:hypothetical protein [Streptomyces sp. NPDC059816]|uniref:hypothetical protein n=1 Tax=Streptomyces sp. NPDC059816 TaxID=3346960 RepID=UPI00366215EB
MAISGPITDSPDSVRVVGDAPAAANSELLQRADRLAAVWDGEPPSGKGGGTAAPVLEAQAAGIPVDRI